MTKFNPDQPGGPLPPFDPNRLSELMTMVLRLQSRGELDCLKQVLAQLNEVDRTIYARRLTDQFTATIHVTVDSQAPTGAQTGNETVELPDGYRPSSFPIPSSKASSSKASSSKASSSKVSSAHSSGPSKPERSSSPVRSRERDDSSERPSPNQSDSDDAHASPMPERIGKFLIKKEIGRGAFGVVYLGYDEELQRNVAVKVSLVSDRVLQERLRVEAAKLAQAESPGIVPVYHIGWTDDGKVYLVQKYIEGSNLRSVLRQHSLSPLAAVSLMREIAIGLEPAHAMEMLHRDLKPDNILIDTSGRSWIADFGLAISEDEQIHHRRELAGTPPYMSPEQILGKIDFLDPRSDIWALGVMFYELLTGKLPFNGKNRKAIAEQICEMDPRPLHQREPGLLTESMNDVFLRCCAKKPSDRFATVGKLVEALDQLARDGLSEQNAQGQTILSVAELIEGAGPSVRRSALESARASGSLQAYERTDRATARTATSTVQDAKSLHSLDWRWVSVLVGLIGLGMVASTLYWRDDHQKEVVDSSNSAKIDNVPGNSPTGNRLGDGTKERPWIVAPGDGGTHTSIQSAITEAAPGDSIRVTPGLYREKIVITKPIVLNGEPPKSGVYPCVIENDERSPLTIDCPDGEVQIRSFMVSGKGHQHTHEFNPIEVKDGSLRLDSCALETRSQNCIKIRGTARLNLQACKFIDSSEFAVSAMDFSQINVVGCDFLCRGIELTGGSGTVSTCKFLGEAGIYVANNVKPLESIDCVFDGKTQERALLATDGGNLVVTGATIVGSKTGAEVTDQNMTVNSPVGGRPGTITLRQSKLQDCIVALQVNGGVLRLSDDSLIDGGLIAIGVSTGSAELDGVSISRVREKAVVVYQGGDLTLRKCNISGCGQTAIAITHGSMTFDGGSIEDFQQYGIKVGDESQSGENALRVTLRDLTVRTASTNKLACLIAYSGKLELHSLIVDGAKVGLAIDGQMFSDTPSDQPVVEVSAFATRFKNQAENAAIVTGNSLFLIDRDTNTSLMADPAKGLKAVAPAQIVIDERID